MIQGPGRAAIAWIVATAAGLVLLPWYAIEGARWLLRRRRHEVLPPDLEDRVSVFLDHASGVEPPPVVEGDAEIGQNHR